MYLYNRYNKIGYFAPNHHMTVNAIILVYYRSHNTAVEWFDCPDSIYHVWCKVIRKKYES